MIVIPMAGLSRRFREAGYDVPKYMLPLHGRTLFAHAVESFSACFDSEPFLFIARDEAGTPAFIEAELARLQVRRSQTIILRRPTGGQADTVRLGLRDARVDGATPLTIFNIDTFRPGWRFPDAPWAARADGYLEVMESRDPGFSFVLPQEGPAGEHRVAATAEKQVISSLASTGVYWFRRAGDFRAALATSDAFMSAGELYVAPLYNALIAKGLDVRYHQVRNEEVIFCGVPREYEALLASPEVSA